MWFSIRPVTATVIALFVIVFGREPPIGASVRYTNQRNSYCERMPYSCELAPMPVTGEFSLAEFPLCLSGPAPAGVGEGTRTGVAQEERDLGKRQVQLVQIPEGQLMPQAVDNLRKARVEIAKPSGKRAAGGSPCTGQRIRLAGIGAGTEFRAIAIVLALSGRRSPGVRRAARSADTRRLRC